jgi:hypothetical protein
MSVKIIPIVDHESYNVNGKEIYKDTNDNWIARQELSTQETMAFNNYKKAVIDNKAFKKHTKAEFKTK